MQTKWCKNLPKIDQTFTVEFQSFDRRTPSWADANDKCKCLVPTKMGVPIICPRIVKWYDNARVWVGRVRKSVFQIVTTLAGKRNIFKVICTALGKRHNMVTRKNILRIFLLGDTVFTTILSPFSDNEFKACFHGSTGNKPKSVMTSSKGTLLIFDKATKYFRRSTLDSSIFLLKCTRI